MLLCVYHWTLGKIEIPYKVDKCYNWVWGYAKGHSETTSTRLKPPVSVNDICTVARALGYEFLGKLIFSPLNQDRVCYQEYETF